MNVSSAGINHNPHLVTPNGSQDHDFCSILHYEDDVAIGLSFVEMPSNASTKCIKLGYLCLVQKHITFSLFRSLPLMYFTKNNGSAMFLANNGVFLISLETFKLAQYNLLRIVLWLVSISSYYIINLSLLLCYFYQVKPVLT